VSYDLNEHRRAVRDHLLHLVRAGGPGWDEHAKARAREAEKEDPTLHEGLLKAVNEAIARRNAEQKGRTE